MPLDEPLAPVPQGGERCETLWASCSSEGPGDRRIASNACGCRGSYRPHRPPRCSDSLCGLIVAGPNAARTTEEAEAIFELAKQLGWPLLADVASGLRFYRYPVMAHYDIFLRDPGLSDLAPDVVLAFGALPTSKS